MIVGQRQVHHRQDFDLAIYRHRTIFNRVHAEDRTLRRVDDRRGHQRTEHTTVGDGEVTARQIFHRQLAVTTFDSQRLDVFLDVSHTQRIDVAQDRGHQTARRGYRHAHVEVVVIHHVVAIDRGVHFRIAFQRFYYRLHVEGHEAQTDTVTFFKRFTVLLTQIHDGLHVHFVEGRQHGSGVFRFQQTLGHAFAQTGHRYAFFATCPQRWLCSRGFCRCFGLGFRRGFRQMLIHIFTSDTSAHTGAFDRTGVEVVLSQQATDRRAQRIVILLFQRSLLTLRRGRRFFFRLRAGFFTRAIAFTQATEDLAGGHGGAFVFQNRIQNAVR